MKKLEIIKYHNDLQTVNISNLTLQESKIFIRLIQEVQNKQNQTLKITFENLKEALARNTTDIELSTLLKSAVKKAISSYITMTSEDKKVITIFSFFTKFQIRLEDKILIAQVNEEFLYLINELIKNYSTLLLSEVIQLKSKYSLLMYKKIREYYKLETLNLSFESLKKYMNLENKTIKYFNEKVFKPINEELPNFIRNFKIEKIKNKKTITAFLFTWKYEDNKDKLANLNNDFSQQ